MEAVIVGATLLSSFVGAFVIQKAALEGLFRIMETERRSAGTLPAPVRPPLRRP
ncbi:MAG TPA: hypothetical protein VME43_17550 [Bryobacteraceae bacterium]|nr:hypothetical protein [Bryobacteraceae bacterium]